MAIITTRINGTTSSNYYTYYANVIVNDTINANNTFTVDVNEYIVNNNAQFNTSGWTINARIDGAGSEILTNQTINTTNVSRYGGETLCISKSFEVPITFGTMFVAGYLTKSSYASYEPGACYFSAVVSLPKVQSMWASSLLSIPNIENAFTLPITKYISDYYNVVEIRNSNNSILVKTINDAVNGTSVTFSSAELSTIYTMDTNRYQQAQRFYMDLKTYTNSSKTTQIGTTQRVTCEGYLSNPNPTATYTIVEQDANVISLLGSSTSSKIIKESSDLLFTITPTTKYSAVVDNVKINGAIATYDSVNQVYVLNATNITTDIFNIVVTDSRNYSTTYEVTKTLLDYLAVKINSGWTAVRASQTSSDIVLNATIDCYSSTIDGQTNTPTIQYSTDGSNWTNITSGYTHTSNKITITNLTISNLISYQTPGKFYLKITDLLTLGQDNKDIPVGIYTFALGDRKARINGTFEIGDTTGNNRVDVGDGIIVEKGTGYIKYGNGLMICYGKETITTAINSSWGSLYVSSLQTLSDYASAFTTIYSCNFDTLLGATNWIGTGETGTTLPTTRPPKIYLLSGASQNSADYVVGYIAIGTWK